MAQSDEAPWGRVGEDGTVFVRTASGERAVGQYPDGSPEEALAYFERKFADLEGQVSLLEQRARRGAPAGDVAKAVAKLQQTLHDANAVGDLASLAQRLDALSTTVEQIGEQQSAEAKAAVDAAIAERTALVEEAEALAGLDPAKAQWKQVTQTLDGIFERWQKHQQEGPRLPKNLGNDLWKRFRAARSTIEQHRRAFFAELDAQHKQARQVKESLIEQAEALEPKGASGIPAYRQLLEEWKQAGRAGKKADDALWKKFKAAGDVLYAAKAEIHARDSVEFEENLKLKLALLDEAAPLLEETDRDAARDRLLSIQRRWEKIGKVPRDHVRSVEDRLRKIEAAVRKLDEEHWRRTDPELQARADGMTNQLTELIAKLEEEVAEAKAAGDETRAAQAQEALDARRAWLDALGT